MKKYVIFGAGNFISSIFDLIHIQGGKIEKVYQNVPQTLREGEISVKQRITLLGYDVNFYDSIDTFEPLEGYEYVVGCVTVQKYRLVEELKEKFSITFSNLIHPDTYIGSNVRIGEGVIIFPSVIVDANANLNDFCVLNKGATVGHDVKVGKYSFISSSATLAGLSTIGDKCYIGMNSSVLDSINIGDWVVIGAGSVVTKDTPNGVVAYGNPAKVKKKNDLTYFIKYKENNNLSK